MPPFLFMVMAWFACSYNVKLRTHLSFSEFRSKMPPTGQMATLTLDAALWLGFCWIAITTSLRFTALSADNFQLVDGVDDVMKWWFYLTVPIAFTLMSGRVVGNWLEDWREVDGVMYPHRWVFGRKGGHTTYAWNTVERGPAPRG